MEEEVSELENWNRICCIRRLDFTFKAEDYVDALDKLIYLAKKELFDKFDKYACVKDDKWYLDLKQSSQMPKDESKEE